MRQPIVDMVVDLQYGSTGKGLAAGHISNTKEYDIVVNANMPNAGHTCIDEKGAVMVHKVLPSGVLGKSTEYLMLGPGSVFSVDQLIREVVILKELGYCSKVLVHEHATVLQDYHPKMESELVDRIGSTSSGAMAATVEKMARDPNRKVTAGAIFGIDTINDSIEVVTHSKYLSTLKSANKILAEVAQGYSLSINGKFYPYCTSRDCIPTRAMAEMAIPHWMLNKVVGVARTFPIRVGGNSGGIYPDQKEISWEDLGVEPEKTTVTNRVRRVFTFSKAQIKEAIWYCGVDFVFLNFCNYLGKDPYTPSPELTDIVEFIQVECKTEILYMGWGPSVNDVY